MHVPVGATLWFDGSLSSVKGILPPESPHADAHFKSGNQPNASTTITPSGEIEDSIWDVPENGETGARAFLPWMMFAGRAGKRDLITWKTRIARFLPIAQGADCFCMLLDGKMGKNGMDGIWGVNLEVTGGSMRHWVQNQTGKTVYHPPKLADPIPVNTAYECSLEILWKQDLTGYMGFRYLNTLIEAKNVQMLGQDEQLGLAFAFYVGEEGSILPDNQRYSVYYSDIQIWELPA